MPSRPMSGSVATAAAMCLMRRRRSRFSNHLPLEGGGRRAKHGGLGVNFPASPSSPYPRASRRPSLSRGGGENEATHLVVTSPAPAKTPSFRLDGRRALITGAGRGIGLAAASALAAAGAQVTLAARTKSEVEQAAAAIRERGEKAEALPLDVTDVEAARRAIAQAGPFQILVNNAGMNRPAYLPHVTVDDFDAIFALNVRAAFFMAQAVARRLIEAKLPGSIINISSQMGHVGAERRTVYCASKHAMEGFTKAMAIELAPHNIRVNSIGPTFLETPMTRPFFENKAFRDEVLSKIKLGRLGQLDEITGAIVFLASDASSLITGSALMLDGGWTAE